jgi:hypothetical protein
MKEIKIVTENYQTNVDVGMVDITCIEDFLIPEKATSCTLVVILSPDNHQSVVKIKFEWRQYFELDESSFLYIPETEVVFFRTQHYWGAIDLEKKVLKRYEAAIDPFIFRETDYMLIYGDLEVESTKLNGDRIHAVPVDPPTESKYFEDRIEFISPGFGRQILRTK